MATIIWHMRSYRIHFKVQKTQNNRWLKIPYVCPFRASKNNWKQQIGNQVHNHKYLGNLHVQPPLQTLHQAFPTTQILPCMHLQS